MARLIDTFDPELCNVTFNGRMLRMFGTGSVITLERREDNVSLTIGAKGDGTYVKNADKSGTLQVILQQMSPDITYLEDCAERFVSGNLTVTDSNDSGRNFSANNCMVQKTPARVRGEEAPDVTFTFLIPELLFT